MDRRTYNRILNDLAQAKRRDPAIFIDQLTQLLKDVNVGIDATDEAEQKYVLGVFSDPFVRHANPEFVGNFFVSSKPMLVHEVAKSCQTQFTDGNTMTEQEQQISMIQAEIQWPSIKLVAKRIKTQPVVLLTEETTLSIDILQELVARPESDDHSTEMTRLYNLAVTLRYAKTTNGCSFKQCLSGIIPTANIQRLVKLCTKVYEYINIVGIIGVYVQELLHLKQIRNNNLTVQLIKERFGRGTPAYSYVVNMSIELAHTNYYNRDIDILRS